MDINPTDSPRQSPTRFQRMMIRPLPFKLEDTTSSGSQESDSSEYLDVSGTDEVELISLNSAEINRLAQRLVELQVRSDQRYHDIMRLNTDLSAEDVFDQGFEDPSGVTPQVDRNSDKAPNASREVNVNQTIQ